MRRLALALLLATALPAAATQEYILPTLFDVTDVAADDVLNIRSAPSARSEIIGTLAPDARRIEVVAHDASGRWGQVNAGERHGWVALRYLAYRTDVWEAGDVPPTLSCAGTEPFWWLAPQAGRLRYATPEDEIDLPLTAILSTGVFRSPRRTLMGAEDGTRLTAVVTPAACSDGMSDRAYGLDATLVIERDGTLEMRTGCCSIAP